MGSGGGGTGWLDAIMLVGGGVAGWFLSKDEKTHQSGSRLGDQTLSYSVHGRPIMVQYGTNRLSGNMLWTRGIEEVEVIQDVSQRADKGGGGATNQQSSFVYYSSFAMAICEGEIATPLKIFLDGKQALDKTGTGSYQKRDHEFVWYTGSTTQEQDPQIVADKGDSVPAHRGIAYLVWDAMPLLEYGNRIPNMTVVVSDYITGTFPQQDVTINASAVPSGGTDEHMLYDENRGYAYQFHGIEGSTYLTRIDVRDGSTLYSVRITYTSSPEAIPVNVDLTDGFNHTPAVAFSPLNRIYGLDGHRIWKIDPTTGAAVDFLDVAGWPGGSVGLNTIGLFSITHPTTGEPVELWVASETAQSRVFYGTTTFPSDINATIGFYEVPFDEDTHFGFGQFKDASDNWLYASAWDISYLPAAFLTTQGDDPQVDLYIPWIDTIPSSSFVLERQRLHLVGSGHPEALNSGWECGGLGLKMAIVDRQIYYDLTGDGTIQEIGGSPIRDGNTLAPIVTGQIGEAVFVREDNTFLFTSKQSEANWYLCKWDIENEDMLIIKGSEDYTAIADGGTCEDEFCVDSLDDGSDIVSGVSNTWRNSNFNWKNPGLKYPFHGTGLDHIYTVDPITLEIIAVKDSSGYSGNAESSYITIGVTEALVTNTLNGTNSGPSILYLDRSAGDPLGLDVIVADICERAGLTSDQYDVTALASDFVRGYTLTRQVQTKDQLIPLMTSYDFGWVDSDWKIKFVKRGAASSKTILEIDLGVGENKSTQEALVPKRRQESENVMRVTVRHIDPNRDYQEGAQEAKRVIDPSPTMGGIQESQVEIAVVFQADEAQAIAKNLLARNWTDRTELETSLPVPYLAQDPLDVVTITSDGQTYTSFIDEANIGAGGQIQVKGFVDDSGIYGYTGFGDSGIIPSQALDIVFASEAFLIDTSLLRDMDDPGNTSFIIYGALGYREEPYPGGTVREGTSQWDLKSMFSSSTAADWGVSTTKLGSTGLQPNDSFGSTQSIDTTNSVNVAMVVGVLSSASNDEDFYSGVAATGGVKGILGNELIQAKTVVANGDGTYTLSNLLRARRGTEGYIHSHGAGERFIILTESPAFHPHQIGHNEAGQTHYVEATTYGQNSASVLTNTQIFWGRSIIPYSPVHVEGERLVTPLDDLVVRWVRRNRVGGEDAWADGAADVLPNNEENESYEIDLITKDSYNAEVHSEWDISATTSISDTGATQPFFELLASVDIANQGDGTAIISGGGFDYSLFQLGAWIRTTEWFDEENNGYAKIVAVTAGTSITVTVLDAADATETASLEQLPTWATFTAAEVAAAGYNTTEKVHVAVYQMSEPIGRGYVGFDPLGVTG